MKKTSLLFAFIAVSLLLKAQFGPPIDLYEPDEVRTYQLISFDLDGDNDEDILRPTINGPWTWIENQGSGNFDEPKLLTRLEMHGFLRTADINGDGRLDLLFNSHDHILSWAENLGGGSYASKQSIYQSPEGIHAIAMADMGNDGDLDIVLSIKGLTSNISDLGWLENDGKGDFGAFDQISVEQKKIERVGAGDLDGDGDKDVVAYNRKGTLVWHENIGSGNFVLNKANKITEQIEDAAKLFVYDFNGDGAMDILLGNTRWWFENDGSGNFSAGNVGIGSGQEEYNGFLEDIDLDGNKDYFEFVTVSRVGAGFSITENKGDGSFAYHSVGEAAKVYGNYSAHLSYSDIFSFFQMCLSDIDSDGDLDLMVADGYQIDWFENLGDFKFGKVQSVYKPEGSAVQALTADLDNDLDMDLILFTSKSNRIVWKENQGRGKLGPAQVIAENVQDIHYSWGLDARIKTVDIDGDGKIDIVYTMAVDEEIDGTVDWFKNLGNGKFDVKKTITSLPQGISSINSEFGDVDGDGDLDLVWSWRRRPNPHFNVYVWETQWWENQGSGTFGIPEIFWGIQVDHMQTADLNGDGTIDIVTGSDFNNGQQVLFRWFQIVVGVGVVLKQVTAPDNFRSVDALPIDVDDDGDMDLLHFSSYGSTQIFVSRNQGNGTFDAPVTLATLDADGQYSSRVDERYVADVDGDGFKDLIWGYGADGITVLSKNLDGKSLSAPIEVFGTDGSKLSDIADFDLDGDPDIIYLNGLSRIKAGWLENFSEKVFSLKGETFYDEDQNGLRDNGEYGLRNFKVQVSTTPQVKYAFEDGSFALGVNKGVHTVSVSPGNSLWNLTSDSSTYTRSVNSTARIVKDLDFAYYPQKLETRIATNISGGRSRCWRVVPLWMSIENDGTTHPSGVVHLKVDDSVAIDTTWTKADSIIGQHVYWNFKDLLVGEQQYFKAYVRIPRANNTDNELLSVISVHEVDAGQIVYTNTDTFKTEVVCAYDPNDKQVSPIGLGTGGLIHPKQKLTYLVRFQNTGNDTAFNVMIRDQLDPDLDWSTMKPIASSHPYKVYVENDGDLVFKLDNILLVDSHTNEPASHGFIEYSIKPKTTLKPLTIIDGPANIYFDFNAPITTNDVLNTISCYIGPKPVISFKSPYLDAGVSGNYDYQWYRNDTLIVGATSVTYQPTVNGNYSIELKDSFICAEKSAPYEYIINSIDEMLQMEIKVYPNPFSESTTIEFDRDLNEEYDLVLYNLLGTEIKRMSRFNGNRAVVDGKEMGKGVYLAYLVQTSGDRRIFAEKLVVQ